MDVVLLTVGAGPTADGPALRDALIAAGGGVESGAVADGERGPLDEVLDRLDGRRLVIAASAGGLAVVLRRLLRRGELGYVETAVLPAEPVPFLTRFGVTADRASAARTAVTGSCRTVGVLKDDSGHLVVDHAEVGPWRGSQLWMRAYVEDARLCDGPVVALRVERGAAGGLRATVTCRSRLGLHRRVSIEGRAMQLACDEAAMTSDGLGRDQPRRKRIWWDEPDQWRLAVTADPTGRPAQ